MQGDTKFVHKTQSLWLTPCFTWQVIWCAVSSTNGGVVDFFREHWNNLLGRDQQTVEKVCGIQNDKVYCTMKCMLLSKRLHEMEQIDATSLREICAA